ncbi:hypothetical protein DL93DRAFT_1298933 [Clavulina sp. PMI_390]|nr:hypothetical protein DL93DRAFT_1298933 [Clavulina sp. PMI_390]
MSVLAKGAACFQCRNIKRKCDAEKPACSRCKRRRLGCVYPAEIAKRTSPTRLLEARALELEIMVHKLTLSSIHDLSLVSARLLKRATRLGDSVHTFTASDTAWKHRRPRPQGTTTVLMGALKISEDATKDSVPALRRDLLESHINFGLSTGVDALPLPSSQHLISLFLPYRTQYYFLMDLSRFLQCVSLPPSHPDSIHPCLLNACYLAACASSRGDLTSFQPYFLQRTRHFLEQSLTYCDRITHFLWASIILGCFLAQERRLDECFAIAGAATRFGFACGLGLPHDPNARSEDLHALTYILPPPEDLAEAMDRIRLAHCLYLLDRTLPAIGNYTPSFPYNDLWACVPETYLGSRDGQNSMEGSELRKPQTDFRITMARNFERVTKFISSVGEQGDYGRDDEYADLVAQINDELLTIPPLSRTPRLSPSHEIIALKSNNIFEHTTPYGSGLILYSVRAAKDPEARKQLLHCVEALVGICNYTRAHRYSGTVRIDFGNLLHIMNAIRVLARELRRLEIHTNPTISLNYCNHIESLLDFVDDVVLLWPAWSHSPATLKDTLTTTLTPFAT